MDPRKIYKPLLRSMVRVLRASESLQDFHVRNSGWSKADLEDIRRRIAELAVGIAEPSEGDKVEELE